MGFLHNRTEAELGEMKDWYREIENSMRQGDAGAELRVDAEASFYSAVTRASGNEYFVEFITMIDGKIMGNLRSRSLPIAMIRCAVIFTSLADRP